MTPTIDNGNLFYSGVSDDVTVNVAANTTLKAGTILGVHKTTGKIVAYTSGDCTANDFYVLLHDVQNSGSSAADFGMVRVLDGGEINRNKLILVNDDDTLTDGFIAKLKTSGILAVKVQEETNTGVL